QRLVCQFMDLSKVAQVATHSSQQGKRMRDATPIPNFDTDLPCLAQYFESARELAHFPVEIPKIAQRCCDLYQAPCLSQHRHGPLKVLSRLIRLSHLRVYFCHVVQRHRFALRISDRLEKCYSLFVDLERPAK